MLQDFPSRSDRPRSFARSRCPAYTVPPVRLPTFELPATEITWDAVWRSDPYARPAERLKRALKRFAHFEDLLPAELSGPALDVGCGSGQSLSLLRERYCHARLLGIDISRQALSRAAPTADATLLRGDISRLPFAAETFSLVTAFGVLEHVPDQKACGAELSRVLRRGGLLLLTTSHVFSFVNLDHLIRTRFGCYHYGYQRNQTNQELDGMFRGLRPVRRRRVHGDPDMRVLVGLDRMLSRIGAPFSRYLYAAWEKTL